MIFSQYTETCEIIIDCTKIGGDDIEDYTKKSIRDIFYADIYLDKRRLLSEFLMDGIKCI